MKIVIEDEIEESQRLSESKTREDLRSTMPSDDVSATSEDDDLAWLAEEREILERLE